MRTKTLLISLLVAATAMGACKKSDKKTEGTTSEKGDPAKVNEAQGAGTAAATAAGTAADPTSGNTATGTDPTGATTTGADPAGATTGAAGAAGITVLDAGAEPRVALRYQLTAGTKQAIETILDMKMDAPPMGSMTMPSMVMGADVEVLSADGGKAVYQTVFKAMEVRDVPGTMPGIADAMKQAGGGMAGLTITASVDATGHASDFKVAGGSLPPEMQQTMDQAKQTMEQAVAQLPEAAVGKGAKWQAKQTVDQGGMKIDQTIVFELLEVTATTARIKAVYGMSAAKQTIKVQGMTATLENLSGSGTMEMAIDLTKPVAAVSGSIDTKTKMSAMGQMLDIGASVKVTITAK